MRHTLPVAVLLALCVGAGPATMPDASAYPALQKLLAKLRAENETLAASLKTAQAENASLREKVAMLMPKAKPIRDAGDDVANKMFKEGDRLVVGMTLDQVSRATGDGDPQLSSENARAVIYTFTVGRPGYISFRQWTCVFDKPAGQLQSYTKSP